MKQNYKYVNYYEKLPKHLKIKQHNPQYELHKLKMPIRGLIVGPGGSGKTNFLLNFIHITSGTFEHIILCTQNKDEPLYADLKEKLKDNLTIYEGYSAIPELKNLETGEYDTALVIFDDMVAEPKQQKIEEYFVRARKFNVAKGGGISCMYLAQSYYRIPKLIRQNVDYGFIIKLSSQRDISAVIREMAIGIDKKIMAMVYDYCCDGELESFLLIDNNLSQIRKGFFEVLNLK